jgi:hypothetical protein
MYCFAVIAGHLPMGHLVRRPSDEDRRRPDMSQDDADDEDDDYDSFDEDDAKGSSVIHLGDTFICCFVNRIPSRPMQFGKCIILIGDSPPYLCVDLFPVGRGISAGNNSNGVPFVAMATAL